MELASNMINDENSIQTDTDETQTSNVSSNEDVKVIIPVYLLYLIDNNLAYSITYVHRLKVRVKVLVNLYKMLISIRCSKIHM
jgi:hypothetical protein